MDWEYWLKTKSKPLPSSPGLQQQKNKTLCSFEYPNVNCLKVLQGLYSYSGKATNSAVRNKTALSDRFRQLPHSLEVHILLMSPPCWIKED